jgi:hypothetical protein
MLHVIIAHETTTTTSPPSRSIFFSPSSISLCSLVRQSCRILLLRVLTITFSIALAFSLQNLISLSLCAATSASRCSDLLASASRRF